MDSTRRNVALLAACQAMLFSINSTLIAVNGLAARHHAQGVAPEGDGDRPHEVGHEDQGVLQEAHHDEVGAGVGGPDFATERRNAGGDGRGREQLDRGLGGLHDGVGTGQG